MSKNKNQRVNNMPMQAKKTDYDIPTFSFKSAMIILMGALIGTIVVPYLLSLVGVAYNLGGVIGITLVTGYAIAYTRYFVESKKGYCKNFWLTYAGFGIALAAISIFWLYLGIYI